MKIILFGAGHVGLALAKQFSEAPEIKQIMVCDRRGLALEHINEKLHSSKIRTHRIGLEQETVIKSILKGFNVVINALPHQFGPKLAKLALQSGLHYIDLGGNQSTYDRQSALADLAKETKKCLLPNSGFSPGLLNIIAIHEAQQYDEVENLTLRSGCLPIEPNEPFNYKLVIAADALLSEYVDPQLQIKNYELVEEPSLTGLEQLNFDNFESPLPLEAFHTGNRINSLVTHLSGKVKNLRYQAIRYAGHCQVMKALNTLEFTKSTIFDVRSQLSYRQLLVRQFEKFLISDSSDLTLMQIESNGVKDGLAKSSLLQMKYLQSEDRDISSLLELTALSTLLIIRAVSKTKHWEKGGFYNPEEILDPKDFLTESIKAGINITRL